LASPSRKKFTIVTRGFSFNMSCWRCIGLQLSLRLDIMKSRLLILEWRQTITQLWLRMWYRPFWLKYNVVSKSLDALKWSQEVPMNMSVNFCPIKQRHVPDECLDCYLHGKLGIYDVSCTRSLDTTVTCFSHDKRVIEILWGVYCILYYLWSKCSYYLIKQGERFWSLSI